MIITSSIANNSNLVITKAIANNSIIVEVEQGDSFESTPTFIENKKLAPVEDQTIINPEAILNLRYQRDPAELIRQDNKIIESSFEDRRLFLVQEQSIEDVIIANNQITDNQVDTTVKPLYLERTTEDVIFENNMIIGNDCNEIAQPLDFEKINKVKTMFKKDKLLF